MSTTPTNWLGISGSDITQALPILGAVAGAFPNTASGSGSGTATTNIQSLLSTLATLMGTSATSGTGTTTTGYGTQGTALSANILPVLNSLMQGSTNLAPYEAQQTQQINTNAGLQSQQVNNEMAARGLATSPVAATAAANINAQRTGAITGMQEQIPLIQQQLQTQNIGTAGNILNLLPKTSTQTQQQTGTTTQSQNTQQTGNTTNNASYTQQMAQKSGGGIGGAIGGFASVLANLFG